MKIRWDARGLSIYVTSDKTVFAADTEGRLYQVTTPRGTWVRNRYHRWFRLRHRPVPHCIPVSGEEIQARLQHWTVLWKRVAESIRVTGDMAEVQNVLHRWIEAFTEFHEADAVRFRQTYGAIPILPPDAYGTVYVRLHWGCRWNRCRFCFFYRETPYRVLDEKEFREHLAQIRAYWGRALQGRRGIFLGDAGAAGLPVGLLEDRIRKLRHEFPSVVWGDIHAFMDGFAPLRRSVNEWWRLRRAGLTRISVGIETGDEIQLRHWNKPVDLKALRTGLRRALRAGIKINLIFLVGERVLDPERHFRFSLEWIRQLEMGPGNRVYLSPLWEGRGWSEENFRNWTIWVMQWKQELRKAGIRAGVHPYYLPRFLAA